MRAVISGVLCASPRIFKILPHLIKTKPNHNQTNMLNQNKNTQTQEANANSATNAASPILEASQHYNTWKEQQGSEIYINSSTRHHALILTMLIDRLTDEAILSYLSTEMGLSNAESLLEECREWSSAPRPEKIQSDNPSIQKKIYEKLLLLWESQMNFPATMEELEHWTPSVSFEFDYDAILADSENDDDEEEDDDDDDGIDTETIREILADRDEDDDDGETQMLRLILAGREEQEAKQSAKSKNSASNEPLLGAPQKKAMHALQSAYQVSIRAREMDDVSISPRTSCLMVAPSGAGKTFLAKSFAAQQKLPYMSINVSTWLLLGMKNEPENYTLVQLAAFVAQNDKGVIYLDEMDKLNGTSDWLTHLRMEIHNLLDAQLGGEILSGMNAKFQEKITMDDLEKLNEKLRKNFFIVGGGTWQDYWESQVSSGIGFNATEEVRVLDKTVLTQHISSELLQRFQQDLILMPPLNKEDFLILSKRVAEQISSSHIQDAETVQEQFLQAVKSGVDSAVKNKIGMRFIEECVSKALRQQK